MPLLLCDLDDTLIDRDAAFNSWAAGLCETHGLPEGTVGWLIELDDHGYAARTDLIAPIIERHGIWPTVDTGVSEFLEQFVLCLEPPSAEVMLELEALRIAGWRLGIVTNGSANQHNKVKATGLDRLFDVCIVSGDVGSHKPERAIFEKAAESLGAPLEGWMIGDNPGTDIKGAADAGLQTVWLRCGRRWERPEFQPTLEVDSLLDGLRHVARMTV